MGKVYDKIDDKIAAWVQKQKMFFVASAPLDQEGSINCSPKGGDTLRIINERCIAYLEYGGSGVETIAHIRDNGRMVIMLCAFEGPPKIFRFHGQGEVVSRNDDAFGSMMEHFEGIDLRGVRSIIKLNVERISDSCGYGVPTYTFEGERPSMQNYIDQTDDTKLRSGLREVNLESIDGLPGITDDEIVAMTPEADEAAAKSGGSLEPLPD